MKERFPKELSCFIVSHIDSVELIEVLLLMRSERDKLWTVEEIDSFIRSNTTSIANRLKYLSELGFVISRGESFQFAPETPAKEDLATMLFNAYQSHRVEITELIYTKPLKEIVSFSNAFNIRGGKRGDG